MPDPCSASRPSPLRGSPSASFDPSARLSPFVSHGLRRAGPTQGAGSRRRSPWRDGGGASALTTTGRRGSAATLRSGGEAPQRLRSRRSPTFSLGLQGKPASHLRPCQNCLTKLSCMYYLCSQQTGERRVPGSVEAIPLTAPRDRSIGAGPESR